MNFTFGLALAFAICAPMASALGRQLHSQFAEVFRPDKSQMETKCPQHTPGEWGQVNQSRDASYNLCVHGKLFPQLYSLGPPKTASTSMSIDLTAAGIECAGAKKEWPFWAQVPYGNDSLSELNAKFYQSMPHCPKSDRRVIADFAPQNLLQSSFMPPILKHVYGNRYLKITFMVMPREPLSLAQSFFYFTRQLANVNVRPGDFKSEVQDFLDKLEKHELSIAWSGAPEKMGSLNSAMPMKDLVKRTMMGSQLKEWLDTFKANQFVVFPYKLFSTEGMLICRTISKKINFDIGCTSKVSHDISSQHPELNEDVPGHLQKKFRQYMVPEVDLLQHILEDGDRHGMTLPLYEKGTPVQDWLQKYW